MKNGQDDANITTFEEMLREHGCIVYKNRGYSMMPLLRENKDIIEIRAKGLERCKKYDVVLYKQESKYILHRILKVLPEGYVLAGDHNTYLEYIADDSQIIGVMDRIIRNNKEIHMNDILYRLYVHVWCDFYPIRMLIIKHKGIIRAIWNKIRRSLKRYQ